MALTHDAMPASSEWSIMNPVTVTDLVYSTRETSDRKKHWVEGGVSEPRTNFEKEVHSCEVINLAAEASDFTPKLDENGFQICSLPSAESVFADELAITSGYYREVESFLLQHCGASRIVIFDHTIRRPGTNRGPIPRTHVDQTTKAAIARVERHIPELSSQLLHKRFQLINVWRPISHPAWNSPLALCDFRSLGDGDMIETDRIDFAKPDAPPGETYSVAHNPGHQWYYHKNLDTSQVILIKCFDSKPDVGEYSTFPSLHMNAWLTSN